MSKSTQDDKQRYSATVEYLRGRLVNLQNRESLIMAWLMAGISLGVLFLVCVLIYVLVAR